MFLSTAAQQWLNVKTGDDIALQSGTSIVHLRVAGGLVRTRPGQRLAVMDIAAAQWKFGKLGKLSRVDLQLERGVDRERFKRDLQSAARQPVGDRPKRATRKAAPTACRAHIGST